jgi:hypothetical protein
MNDREVPSSQTAQRQTVRETTDDVETTRATEMRETEEAGFLPDDRMDGLRRQWNDVQAAFVDDPRSAVQRAHQLVTDLVKELTDTFTRERSTLEDQWSRGGEADTEALRVALQRYRTFFNRLLEA